MKRVLLSLIIVLISCSAWAVESCSITNSTSSYNSFVTAFTIVTAADGSFGTVACTTGTATSSAAVRPKTGEMGVILSFTVDPTGTNPQVGYDITIEDANGVDLAGGNLNNRSATAIETVAPGTATGDVWPATFDGPLTLTLANNNVNSATITVYVNWVRRP